MSHAPTILLRSAWAFGNIGDIAITPGMLRLIEQHIPEANVILHPACAPQEITTYLSDRFARLRVADGHVGQLGEPMSPAVAAAFAQADLLLHASGPMIAYGHRPYDGPIRTQGWRAFDWNATIEPLLPFFVARERGLPFGGFGLGVNDLMPPSALVVKSILNDAAFFYTRETESLQFSRANGINPPVMGMVPDCTFAFDMRDDVGAECLMEHHGLEEGKFLVVILRSSELVFTTPRREAHHAWQLRQWIKHWIDRTGMPVFLCPETRVDVQPTGRLLYEPLPARYKAQVRWHDQFWMPCLAASMYQRAHSMVTMDHHSAILALAAGTPVLHPRDPMAGRKGQIFRDLELGDWLFDIDQMVVEPVQAALDRLIDQPTAARERVRRAMRQVHRMQTQVMQAIRALVMHQPATPPAPAPLPALPAAPKPKPAALAV